MFTEVAFEELRHWQERDRFLSRLGRIAENCWLILLRVYTAQDGSQCCIASCTRGLHLGLATTLRYVGAMEELGYLRSSVDPLDQRKRYLSLTEESRRQMDAILSRYPSAGMAVSTIEPQRYGWAGPSW